MNNPPPRISPCDHLQDRLKGMFPEMTFRAFPQDSVIGGFKIYGLRTKNMRYDRPNYYAAFDLSSEAYNAVEQGSGGESLLRSAVAQLELQLRARDK